MLAVVLFMFLSVSVYFASTQIMHARRIDADRGKLQATYAAEAGVFSAFDASRALPRTTFWQSGGDEAAFEVTRDAVVTPCWLTATGTATIKGAAYVSTVKGYVVGRRIVLWDFQ